MRVIILSFVVVAWFGFSQNAFADPPVCGTLEECQIIRAFLHEIIPKQESEVIRDYLQAQLTAVEARVLELLQCPTDGQERITTSGAVFICDRSHLLLGEAWRDQRGLIWGDVVRTVKGDLHYMKHAPAAEYCDLMGAHLPTREEFSQLRQDMGASTPEGYTPQALPNLSGHGFWSSGDPNDHDMAYFFDGTGGDIGTDNRIFKLAVRCVVSSH